MSDDLWDLSTEELEARMKAERAQEQSPETAIEEEYEEVPSDDGSDEEIDGLETDDDDLEQPEDSQDSDHDASTEGSEEAETEEDDKSNPDEEGKLATEVDADKGKEVQPVQTFKVKANGKEFEFTEQEMKDQFPRIFGQAMDYTRKMQTIKPWRKTIDALEQAKLSHEDISLAIDVLKGDKDAIAEVIKRKGIDALDLDIEGSNYVAKDYGRDETTLALKDVLDDISKDAESDVTFNVLNKEWDEKSWNIMSKDPEIIKGLHIDIKTGMYDQVQPLAQKLKVYDGGKKSDFDYYIEAARIHLGNKQRQEMVETQRKTEASRLEAVAKEQKKVAEVKAKVQTREKVKVEASKRKAAAPTKSVVGKPNVTDLLDADDDEAYYSWLKGLNL